MDSLALCTLLLLVTLSQCTAYKVLLLFPVDSRSHNILGRAYVKHLLEAGHEVTYVTPFPTNRTTKMYHEVDLSKNLEVHVTKKDNDESNLKNIMDKSSETGTMNMLRDMNDNIKLQKKTLYNDNMMKFLGDTSLHFDAVIAEWLFSDVYAGFAAVYNCPLIWSSSMEPHWMVLKLVHELSNPAFNPYILSISAPPFSFYERATSLIDQLMYIAANYFYAGPTEKALYEEYFAPYLALTGRALPEYEDVIYNGSLLLTNSHSSISQSICVPSSVKEIAGYHIDSNIKPLPSDLQKLMDEAKDGVIYFSMGTYAESKYFPDVLKQKFLRVFGGLKQTVIWKFEEQFPHLPKNVHILKWAPQQSILAHPNVRLFITQCGLLSTTEAVYFGVPTIVIPYGFDTYLNAERAVKQGLALKVDLSYEMADDMKLAIGEVLSNPKYANRVKQLSKYFHDRLVPPGKELVHWVEHVIKTSGAPHLRSPALLMPWYQKAYLDLLLLIVAALCAIKLISKQISSIAEMYLEKIELLKSHVNNKKSV